MKKLSSIILAVIVAAVVWCNPEIMDSVREQFPQVPKATLELEWEEAPEDYHSAAAELIQDSDGAVFPPDDRTLEALKKLAIRIGE